MAIRTLLVALLVVLLGFAAIGRVTAQDQENPELVEAQCECSCPCPDDSGSGSGSNFPVTWYGGSSSWWMAVTIPGSRSVRIDCGNGQGYVNMSPGWASYMWTFSSSNGQPCKSTVSFIVNDGAAQSIKAPF